MALNQLSNKLDRISSSELDIIFDDAAVWTKLEVRLNKRKWMISPWWAAAACLAFFTLFPTVILKETAPSQVTTIETQQVIPLVEEITDKVELVEEANGVRRIPIHQINRKSVRVELAGLTVKPTLDPIEIQQEKRELQFAAEDISVIQASLGRPKTKNGRTMTIRAQWQKSPAKSNVEYQALKIKLYEKNE